MVETVLFSIFHRASPAATPLAEREPQAIPAATREPPSTDTAPPETPASPEPAADLAAPHESHSEPSPRLESVLEALGIHPPEPIQPDETPAADHGGAPEPQPEAAIVEALQPPPPAWPELTPRGEAEPPQEAATIEALQPPLADWRELTPPGEAPFAEPTAHHGEAELPQAEVLPDAHMPAWPEPSPPQENFAAEAFTWPDDEPAPLPQSEAPDEPPEAALAPVRPDAQYHPEPLWSPHAEFTPEQPESHAQTAETESPHTAPGVFLEHQLLGLANPAVFTVRASLGDSDPIDLTTGRAGIYRPAGFRPAPWSGFAYDTTDDRRTGLATGTRLLTGRGEVPVEDLVPGDVALGLRGPTLLPILWIGRSNAEEPPIRIEAGALGPDRPRRSLCVAADHPVFLDPIPAPARLLVNGVTIYAVDISSAELFHIDVGSAEVLFAEGLPVASAEPNHTGRHPMAS